MMAEPEPEPEPEPELEQEQEQEQEQDLQPVGDEVAQHEERASEELQAVWREVDREGSGRLPLIGMIEVFDHVGMVFGEEESASAFAAIDVHGRGVCEYEQFASWWADQEKAYVQTATILELN